MARELKTRSSAILLIVIIAAILIVLNLISINVFGRLDLTDDHIYSLSSSSKQIVGNLTDRLTIKAFITENLPPPHNGDARYLKDLLDDYKAYSNGYLQYEFIDPAKDNKEDEAQSYRIPPLQFNVFRNDKTEFIKGYKGVVLLYGDKMQTIPFIENTDNLEYDLTRAINKLVKNEVPSIAFAMGDGEPDLSQGLSYAYQVLSDDYRVQFLDLKNIRNIPDQIKALFVVQPKDQLTAWELYLIDQYIMHGGHVAFLMNEVDVDIQKGTVAPITTGVQGLLNNYGVGIEQKLLIDLQCNMIPVTRNMGSFQMQSMVRYPFYAAISNFNHDIPIVKDFKKLDFLFISPLDLTYDLTPGTTRQILFTSSEKSGERELPVDIAPEKKYVDADFGRSDIPLGAVLTGKFKSYYANLEAPEYEGPDTSGTTAFPNKLNVGTDDARIVVIGNGTFITDDFKRAGNGFVLLLNIADWLTQDQGLIAIRSKQVTGRTLDVVSDSTRTFVKYSNMLGMPLLVIIFGLVRWQFKRSARKRRSQ